MARRSRVAYVRPKARSMVWLGLSLDNTVLASNAATLILSLNAAALALRPFTVTRTRFGYRFTSDQNAASEVPAGVLTAQVVTDQAVAAGVASVPSGIAEADADFFVYESVFAETVILTAVGFDQTGSNKGVVDSKAMRKVGNNQDIAIVVELEGQGGAELAIEGRMLVKLH